MDIDQLLLWSTQGTRSLEEYVAEYLNIAQYSNSPDCTLIDFFCDGVNQPLKSQLIREGPRSSLSHFLDYALLTVGSPFTSSACVMAAAPDNTHKMAATTITTPSQVTVDLQEQRHAFADRPEQRHAFADRPEQRHAFADRPEQRHAFADRPEQHHAFADRPEQRHAFADRPEQRHVFADRQEQSHVAADRPESRHVSRSVRERRGLRSSVTDSPLISAEKDLVVFMSVCASTDVTGETVIVIYKPVHQLFPHTSLLTLSFSTHTGSLGQLDVCGRAPLSNRIVGGENATAGSWPWQVSIHVFGTSHNCGGTLITKDWVLSAAHCFQNFLLSDVVMYFGRLNQSGSNPNEISRTARQIINHPNYNSSTFDNDIALVQLSSPVNFTDYIKPVCLAAAGSVFDGGMESWATGWGRLQPDDTELPDRLQEVMIPIVNNSDCNNAYEGAITNNMICAGLLNQGGKSACQGDSGGPMVSRKNSLWIQSGIVSFGMRCADPKYPTVFARVSQFQEWIVPYMGSNPPGFVEFKTDIQQSTPNTTKTPTLTSNSNFGSVPNLLLFSVSLMFSIIPVTLSLYLAS
ncbi:Serine protease 27 [Anabarilius grahami]|uniref:Serine protease 27 n=1 Tax=Anabarilius grahami TaxID=495550 RepID=A0A3N0XZW8_ANAGA|nr:Serine protease 27 [Anabarilius grahami]